MPWCVPDFETRSMCDLKAAGAYRYAEDPTTEVLVLKYCFGDDPIRFWHPGEPPPQDILDAIAAGETFVAHNASFEKSIWKDHMVALYGFPPIPASQWHDTMAVAAMRALPQALDKLTSVLNLPHQKDLEGNRLIKALSRFNKKGMLPELTPAIRARVDDYCDHDVLAQRGVHQRIGWLPPGERDVWLLNQRVNQRGLKLDMPLVRAMQSIVDQRTGPLSEEFRAITGGLDMTQVAKVHGWLMDQGVLLPNLTKETLDSVLGQSDEPDFEPDMSLARMHLPDNVYRALSIRHLIGSASIKKLRSMEACVMADGRARGLLQYHGTMPGRQAGRLFQPHNFPRGTIKALPQQLVDALMMADPDYVEAIFGPAVETVVSALRHTIVPEANRVFIAGDLAGIQARTVLGLAGQHDKTTLMAAGADVYIDMACDIYPHLPRPNWLGDKDQVKAAVKAFKEKYPEERQDGKNSVLGLGFQMGDNKFHDKYCPDQPLSFATKVVKAYREDWAPKVPDVWDALGTAALETVLTGYPHDAYGCEYRLEDAWMTVRLPSGRKLWYFNPQRVRRNMPWATEENPDVRVAWTYQTMKMGVWRTVDAFGGLLTENVVMGIERDLMVNASFLCEKNGHPLVLEVHDELVLEPLRVDADEKAVQQMMTEVPAWCREMKIPVATETWIGDRYKK